MKLLVAIFCFFALTACAQLTHKNNTIIFDSYQKYVDMLNEPNSYSNKELESIWASYSNRYQNEMLNTRQKTPELLRRLIKNYLSFPQLLKAKISHFESIDNENGCLVINGKSIENEKITFYITFVHYGNWTIDKISIEHMANYNQYIMEANCAKSFRDDLRTKEMISQ